MNAGVPLDLDWIEGVRVNTSAVERRTTTLTARMASGWTWEATAASARGKRAANPAPERQQPEGAGPSGYLDGRGERI